MNLRRIVLDVDKAKEQPTLLEIAEVIEKVPGVAGANIAVDDVDMETIGMQITVVGEKIEYDTLISVIENAGAALHSVDEVVVGGSLVERTAGIPRER